MKTQQHYVPNGAGHRLALFQTYDESKLDRSRNPVVIVPGYGMNSFIFSYHPSGVSLEGYLAEAGFEVWRADLRGQGESLSMGGGDDYSLEDLALTDVKVVLDGVLERSLSGKSKADVIGCSLGGTLMFIHAALNKQNRMDALVSMGSPVRWVKVHPLVRVAFSSPSLVGMVRVKGTRKIAEWAVPHLVKRTPWLLSVYMNPEITDTSAIRDLVRTVEDPNRHINREIAQWVRSRDLVVRGVNVGEALRDLKNPLLAIAANGDGIVPPETASFPYYQSTSPKRSLLEVGTAEVAMAHADMFVSREAHERVFRPLAEWLKSRLSAGSGRGPPSISGRERKGPLMGASLIGKTRRSGRDAERIGKTRRHGRKRSASARRGVPAGPAPCRHAAPTAPRGPHKGAFPLPHDDGGGPSPLPLPHGNGRAPRPLPLPVGNERQPPLTSPRDPSTSRGRRPTGSRPGRGRRGPRRGARARAARGFLARSCWLWRGRRPRAPAGAW